MCSICSIDIYIAPSTLVGSCAIACFHKTAALLCVFVCSAYLKSFLALLRDKYVIFVFLLQCVVGGCNASFASQGGLARHVPSHFSQQSCSKMSSQAKLKEESPSKAGLNKRKKLKNKRRCSLRTYLTDTQINPTSK